MNRSNVAFAGASLLALWAVGCEPTREDLCAGKPGTLCTDAGTGVTGFSGDGGDAYDAAFYYPTDVVVRPGTNEYVVIDFNNHKIRMVDADHAIQTVIGTALPGDGAADHSDRDEPGAPALEVGLNHPVQAEWGPDGKLYMPNWHNHKVRVWDPQSDYVVVIVADTDPAAGGTGGDDGNGSNAGYAGDGGPAEDALLFFPNSVAFGPSGEFYVADQKNGRIRVVEDGVIGTVAGAGTLGFSGDGGDAMEAEFRFVDDAANLQPEPAGAVEVSSDGMLYVADTYNHCVRKVDLGTGVIEAVAGTGAAGYSGDGGPAVDALLNTVKDIELSPDESMLYVADTDNHVVRAIDLATGLIETVAGTGDAGIDEDGLAATSSKLNRPYGIDFAADGTLLIADHMNGRIARVTP